MNRNQPLSLILGLAVLTQPLSVRYMAAIITGAIKQYEAWKTIRRRSARKKIFNFYVSLRLFLLFLFFFFLALPCFWGSLSQVQRSCVQCEIQHIPYHKGEAHLPGTKQRRWSDDSEPGTAVVLPSAPEPQSNPLEFHHRRSSWHKSGNTWGREILCFTVCIYPLALFIPYEMELFFLHCLAVVCCATYTGAIIS